jgi:hypothetical protein
MQCFENCEVTFLKNTEIGEDEGLVGTLRLWGPPTLVKPSRINVSYPSLCKKITYVVTCLNISPKLLDHN